MCCFFAALFAFGPRLAVLIWWLISPARFNAAFDGFLIPLLGFIFLPWTLIMYLIVFPDGVTGFDWIWLGLGLLADIASYTSGGYTNRDRLSGSSG